MSQEQTLHTIKTTIKSFLPESKVLLFGSRVRGEANNDSDYDLLVVTADTLDPNVKMNWENKIRKALVHSLRAAFDVILESESEIDTKRKLTGHIVYYAMKEAVEI